MKRQALTGLLVLSMLGSMALVPGAGKVNAGSAVTLTQTGFANNVIPASNSATDVTFTFDASAAVEASGSIYTFTVSPALPSALADCTTADLQADASGSDGAGAFSNFSTTGAEFTTTAATSVVGKSFCLKFPANITAASYSVSLTTTGAQDWGAMLLYASSDNQVTVRASVTPTLSFNIRTMDDTADTNVCNLGVLTTAMAPDNDATVDAAAECGYALAVGTNANGGFSVSVVADGKLRTATHEMADVAGGAWAAGTEAYGLARIVLPTTGLSTAPVATPAFNNTNYAGVGLTSNATAAPISNTSAQEIVSADGPLTYVAGDVATDTFGVIHGAAISTSTPSGSYTQLLTYTVTGTF